MRAEAGHRGAGDESGWRERPATTTAGGASHRPGTASAGPAGGGAGSSGLGLGVASSSLHRSMMSPSPAGLYADGSPTPRKSSATDRNGAAAAVPSIPGSEGLRALISAKERELHDINEFRLRAVEASLREAQAEVEAGRQRFAKLKEDFAYNLRLFEERDKELESYESTISSMKATLRTRDSELADARVRATEAEAALEALKGRSADADGHYREKIKELRTALDAERAAREEDMKRAREEISEARREAEARLRQREEEAEAARREVAAAFDAAMAQQVEETRRREDEAAEALAALTKRAEAVATEAAAARREADESRRQAEAARRDADGAAAAREAADKRAQDAIAAKDQTIATLEAEKESLTRVKADLLSQYEGRMGDLLASLHAVERAFAEQKQNFEEEISRREGEKEAAARDASARMDSRLGELTEQLKAGEEVLASVRAELAQVRSESDAAALEHEVERERLSNELEEARKARAKAEARADEEARERERAVAAERERGDAAVAAADSAAEEARRLMSDIVAAREREEEVRREAAAAAAAADKRIQELQRESEESEERMTAALDEAKARFEENRTALRARLNEAEEEVLRLRQEAAAADAKARLATLTARSPSPAIGAGTDDEEFPPASPLQPLDSSLVGTSGGLTQALDAGAAERFRQRAEAAEAQVESLRAVVASMRQQMVELSSLESTTGSGAAAGALPSTGSVGVPAGGVVPPDIRASAWAADRTVLEARLKQLQQEVQLLRSEDAGDRTAEAAMLRRQMAELDRIVADLRRELYAMSEQAWQQSSRANQAEQRAAAAEAAAERARLQAAEATEDAKKVEQELSNRLSRAESELEEERRRRADERTAAQRRKDPAPSSVAGDSALAGSQGPPGTAGGFTLSSASLLRPVEPVVTTTAVSRRTAAPQAWSESASTAATTAAEPAREADSSRAAPPMGAALVPVDPVLPGGPSPWDAVLAAHAPPLPPGTTQDVAFGAAAAGSASQPVARAAPGDAAAMTSPALEASAEEARKLRAALEEASGDLSRMVEERERLIELSNQLRSDLGKVMATRGRVGSPDRAATARRVAHIESTLDELEVQNRQLAAQIRRKRDRKTVAAMTRRRRGARQASRSDDSDDSGEDRASRRYSSSYRHEGRRRSTRESLRRRGASLRGRRDDLRASWASDGEADRLRGSLPDPGAASDDGALGSRLSSRFGRSREAELRPRSARDALNAELRGLGISPLPSRERRSPGRADLGDDDEASRAMRRRLELARDDLALAGRPAAVADSGAAHSQMLGSRAGGGGRMPASNSERTTPSQRAYLERARAAAERSASERRKVRNYALRDD